MTKYPLNPNKPPVVPFIADDMRWITFRAMQQAGQVIATCLSNSDLGAKDVDYICSFKEGHTAHLLVKCLDWDGEWPGPSIRDMALIARACGFRLDFTLEKEPLRSAVKQQQVQAPEGVSRIDSEDIQERSEQEPIDPKNPPVTL